MHIGRIVEGHIQDKPFFDSLPHGIAMERFALAPENRQCLMFWCRSKSKQTQVWLLTTLGHAAIQFLQVLNALLRSMPARFLMQRLTAKHLFQVSSGFTGLGTVGLIDNHCKATCRQTAIALLTPLLCLLQQLPSNKRELLQRGDDDRHSALQSLGYGNQGLHRHPQPYSG